MIKLGSTNLIVYSCLSQKGNIILVNIMQSSFLLVGIISDFFLCLNSVYILAEWQLRTNTHIRDHGGRTKNLPAGWVADNSIQTPGGKGDFWLLSHAGLLGSKITVIPLILRLNSYCSIQPAAQVIMC
jgi:hypothetical protein